MWFAPDGVEPVDQLDFLNPGWHAFAAEEHNAVRTGVALIDQSSFAKFEMIGAGSLELLQRLAACNMDKPNGTVIYAQLCNETGGIEADLTITRLGRDHFYIVTGSGFGTHDADWIRRHMPKDGSVHLIEVTSARAVINICGPKAREVLETVCENDVSNVAFPFGTAQDVTIGAALVRAVRIGFVGELGWELHVPTEFAAHVYDTLKDAGQAAGIRDVGYRAIDSLRMEKGYLYWSGDISPDYTPIEAGLGFRVHLKSGGDFIGRDVLAGQKAAGPDKKLCTFVCNKKLPLYGGETILQNGKTVSLVTSAGFGCTVKQMIMFAYLPKDMCDQTVFTVEVFGERTTIKRVDGSLYDPQNEKLKA